MKFTNHKVSKKRAKQIRNDDKLRMELLEQCEGLCMICHERPDWRGLSLSHTHPKKMGGTTHQYTIDEVQLICGRCHSRLHGITEK